MALGVRSNWASNRHDTAGWAGKLAELIHRESGAGLHREILELIQFGQVTGVLRKDLEPQLLVGIILGVRKLYHDYKFCSGDVQGGCSGAPPGDLIGNVVGILLNGFNRKGDVREGN